MKMEQSVPKRRHIKFRRRGITQKKEYKQNKVLIYLQSDYMSRVHNLTVQKYDMHKYLLTSFLIFWILLHILWQNSIDFHVLLFIFSPSFGNNIRGVVNKFPD